ncbi:MAG: phosphate ABC transporter substrate-binding protein [Armatimonadetes bacterium]|nr:phosphate ABC transporter substrate-binding protein [Armatimonadota bacterium]
MARWRVTTFLATAACGLLLPTFGCGRPRPGEQVVIKGSDTMVGLGQRWAEAFVKSHQHILVSVTGGGSGTGIAALVEGTCDIAQASREIKKDELEKAVAAGRRCVERVVAWDGVAVIVNPANPVSKVTLEQLSDLFQGKITNWRELGGPDAPVVLLARETSSGTHAFFKKRVLQLGGKRKGADYAAAAILSTSSQTIHDEVASNPNAIGYVGLAYIEEDVKALAVAETPDGPFVPPTVETVMNRTYPISRPLYVYADGEPEGATKEFLDFALSPLGQSLVTDMGFVPVPKYAGRRAEVSRAK